MSKRPVGHHVTRAKMRVSSISGEGTGYETLAMHAVAASKYPEDGSDENNTFAKFSPSASLSITIANPALHGAFTVGEEYYVDLTLAKAADPVPAPAEEPAAEEPIEDEGDEDAGDDEDA